MKKLFLTALVSFGLSSFAQQKPVELKLNLLDGNVITGTSQMGDIELMTNYGKLTIPVANVSTVKVGIGKDKTTSDKALSFLKILNTSTNDDTRKSAYQDILKLGAKAISAVSGFNSDPKNYNENSTYVGEYTVEALLTELHSANNIDDNAEVDDIVTIDGNYTMGGAFNFGKFDIKTEYGNLSIPKEKIKTVDVTVISPPGSGDFTFKLLGSKNISGNQNGGWLKTGIMLKTGQKFSITATGEVTLASLSNQKYKPDGSYTATNGTNYPAAAGGDYDGAVTYPAYGNVVYHIGDASTEANKAGAKFNGTAKTSGMLYIAIYETVYNAANTGSYTVKVMNK
ncbi:MAG TPA: hypothetical protein VN026_18725 [Bacteroidia bacterium]|jgi:hypothetical protein|nr:hypothetical protein [Bacteroidia bacterium]